MGRAAIDRGMRSRGIGWRDSVAAIFLAKYIFEIDRIVFPNSTARIQIVYGEQVLDPLEKPKAAFAGYVRLPNGSEEYHVCALKIAASVRSEGKGLRFVERRDGVWRHPPPSGDRRVKMDRLLFAIACHEVRHRVQFHFPHLRIFRRDSTDEAEPLRSILLRLNFFFQREERSLLEKGASLETIAAWTGDNEMDARVLDLLATHEPSLSMSAEEIKDLLLLEAPLA